MTFIFKDHCVYRVLIELYDMYDLTKPSYVSKCNACNGQRDCRTTLDQVLEFYELSKLVKFSPGQR